MTMINTRSVGLVLLAVVLAPNHPHAQRSQLPPLIQQNVDSARRAQARVFDVKAPAPQLWIHVRNGAQKREVEKHLAWFSSLQVDGQKVVMHPLQLVSTGPTTSQLRFFKPNDQAQAAALQSALKPAVPRLVLSNLSQEYAKTTWIDPGHYELWLSPDVTQLSVR
jgi:hypothetical protein